MGIQGSFFDFFCFGMAGYQPVQPEAHACELLIKADRGLYFTIEQPAQSWGLKQACILNIKAMAGMCLSSFCLGFWPGLGQTRRSCVYIMETHRQIRIQVSLLSDFCEFYR